MNNPLFLITIDTEGDNIWSRTRDVTTRNARSMPRFQELCERYGLKPTYLTNYEMARDSFFVEFARDAQARGTAEVGMHLHAWHSPPFGDPLTSDDYRHHPYLIEFPENIVREKIVAMTRLLEETFDCAITSHRAGRWSMNAHYANSLADLGYTVDCSATPYVSWASHKGDPRLSGGTDYRFCPEGAYFADDNDMTRPGHGRLLEMPMTIAPRYPLTHRHVPAALLRISKAQAVIKRILPNDWLRPMRGNLAEMTRVIDVCSAESRPYAMFMTHSSELMAGGSPNFKTQHHIDALYDDLEQLFDYSTRQYCYTGATLSTAAADFLSKVQ